MNDPTPSRIDPNALTAEQARLARYFQRINKHRKALDLAIEEDFGGTLDPAEWRSAFESTEPRDANRTMVVTGDHSAVLNAYVEILRASAERALRPRGTAGARLPGRRRRGGPRRDRATPPSTPRLDRKRSHLAAPSRGRASVGGGERDAKRSEWLRLRHELCVNQLFWRHAHERFAELEASAHFLAGRLTVDQPVECCCELGAVERDQLV